MNVIHPQHNELADCQAGVLCGCIELDAVRKEVVRVMRCVSSVVDFGALQPLRIFFLVVDGQIIQYGWQSIRGHRHGAI